MALKDGQPALRAEWIEEWVQKGRLEVRPIYDTKILVVIRDTEAQKDKWRYWLGRGTILVPRRISDSVTVYQHVCDLLAAKRQQDHIADNNPEAAKARKEAINRLIAFLCGILSRLENSLLASLSSRTIKDFLDEGNENGASPQALAGLRAKLAKDHYTLDGIMVRPIVKSLQLAQRHLWLALGAIDTYTPTKACYHIRMAAERIRQARLALEEE